MRRDFFEKYSQDSAALTAAGWRGIFTPPRSGSTRNSFCRKVSRCQFNKSGIFALHESFNLLIHLSRSSWVHNHDAWRQNFGMPQTFHRDRTTWLAYLSLAFYGYYLNILGPITPFLKTELQLTYTVSSFHFTAFAMGILMVGLIGHLLIQYIGQSRALWLGLFGMSLSAVILSFGTSPIITIGASFLMGLIGSLILAIVPAALSDQQ